MEEKIKELETELNRVKKALSDSETENVQLKNQLKKMIEGEENLRLQLTALQESLEIISFKHKDLQNVKDDTSSQVQEYGEKISELKSLLNQSSIAQSELEAERDALTDRVAEHERRTKATTESSLELKGLMQRSHSKVEDSNRRVSDFEKLLETEKTRISEFEREIETLEDKYESAEAEKKKYSDLVSQLTTELEKSNMKVSSLEDVLEGASQKEKVLRESLDVTSEEKRNFEEALQDSTGKIKKDEGLIGVLSNELNATQGKLVSTVKDNKAAGIREGEIVEKLKSAEGQLEEREKVLEEEKGKTTELESVNETLIRNSDVKLKGLVGSFANKDNDMQSLCEKLELLKDQITAYKDQTTEAARKSTALKEELDQTLSKVGELEASNEELKKLKDQAESKAAQAIMEKELLGEMSSDLKKKVYELQQQIEDLTKGPTLEREKFQNEQKQDLVDNNVASQNDLQSLLTKLEGQVKEYRGMNESLKDELEKLTLETAHNSARGTTAKDLEEKLKVVEADMIREVESVRASAAAREAELTSKLEQHMNKAQDDDTITLTEEGSVRSRDIGSNISSPTKRKMSGSASEDTQVKTVGASATHTSLKLVFGVALASIIIGLVLGKNY